MAFWNVVESEPKRAHRWLLRMDNFTTSQGEYQQYLAKSVTKPAFTISETEHKFLGNTFYYPGAVTWEPVTATIVNALSPNGDRLLFEALYKMGYFDPDDQSNVFNNGSQLAGPGTVNKFSAAGTNGIFSGLKIIELNGMGANVGEWTLENAWLTNAKFGDLDYSAEDLLNIELTIRYDYAIYSGVEGSQEDLVTLGSDGVPSVVDRSAF